MPAARRHRRTLPRYSVSNGEGGIVTGRRVDVDPETETGGCHGQHPAQLSATQYADHAAALKGIITHSRSTRIR